MYSSYKFHLYNFIIYNEIFFLKMKTEFDNIIIMEADAECQLFGNILKFIIKCK